MSGLSLTAVCHKFGAGEVLKDVNLTVAAGEIACLLGPSGCGKTTLLRIAAGLERLQAGTVSIAGRVVADDHTHLPPEQRGVGLMFQDFALFPHLSVLDNVAFGLNGRPRKEISRRARTVLDQVGMTGAADDYPHTLSGGQQQRVALARALAPEPGVMLLDEPFSGLDQGLRVQIREDTRDILKNSGAATLMVTHHPEEALFMGDAIQVMSPAGEVLQSGAPTEVYTHPKDSFVASFFGPVNRVTGVVAGGAVETPLGAVAAPDFADGARVEIIIRHHGLELQFGGGGGTAIEIVSARPLGRTTHVRFRVKNGAADLPEFQCRVAGLFSEPPSATASARILPGQAFIFPRPADGA